MASKRVNKLAGELVTKMLAEAGITKSTGSTAAYMPYALGLAESVVMVERSLKQAVREVERNRDEIGRLIDLNGQRISHLAASYGVYMNPSASPLARTAVDLDLERFGVQLAERKLPEDGYQPYYPGHSVNPEHDGN